MALIDLTLTDVRCLERAELSLDPRLNLITGDNGSGKTSLLEAIYLLGRGRTFRTQQTERVIRHGAAHLLVFGRNQAPTPIDATRLHRIGVQSHRDQGTLAHVDGVPVRTLATLADAFPVQVIDPGIHRLIDDGPGQRRRWLDWAVFHVEPTFLIHWQSFARALKQRNAALKGGGDPTLWDPELARAGEAVHTARQQTLEALQPYWAAMLDHLGALPADLSLHAGWRNSEPLAEALARHLVSDRARGTTSVGPHRADIRVSLNGQAAREQVSRGQQKILGATMTLAMTALLRARTRRVPTLLLDDPAAELDAAHTQALLAAAQEFGSQLIVTALNPAANALGEVARRFHVEQGRVTALD